MTYAVRDFCKTLASAALIGTLVFGMFFSLNYLSLDRSPESARANVRQGFVDGDLGDWDRSAADVETGTHQLNDCLIIGQAIDGDGSIAQRAVTPSNSFVDRDSHVCQNLRRIVGPNPGVRRINFYHNYIHGHTMLARFMLPVLRVREIRLLYRSVLSFCLLMGLYLSMRQLVTGRPAISGIFWTIFFVVFSRWFGLEVFGQSLGHAPADIVLIAYAVFLSGMTARGGISERTVVVSGATFGALTIIFEFFTGGTPLGLALMIGGVPFALTDRTRLAVAVTNGLVAFIAAAAACLALKILLVSYVFGFEPLSGAFHHLLFRMSGDVPADIAPRLSIGSLVGRLVVGLDSIVPGMRMFVSIR